MVFTFSALVPGVVSLTDKSAVTFLITEWNSLLQWMTNVCFPFCCMKIFSLPASCKIYTSLHEVFPKFMSVKSTGTSGFRSHLCLCTALWTSAGGACYSFPSASYTSNSELQALTQVLTLTCWWVVAASVKKALATYFKWSTCVNLGPSVLC